ncbi:unnamed protein product [Blepharisma stoltei]|uniref:Uncharacterized protein n=1 Tax=Blepharisma stoltei TaxID=1481888 RepID=A0AAU9J5T2_9CILI|nr:unnamed protein product [Blepharisma stoltei]
MDELQNLVSVEQKYNEEINSMLEFIRTKEIHLEKLDDIINCLENDKNVAHSAGKFQDAAMLANTIGKYENEEASIEEEIRNMNDDLFKKELLLFEIQTIFKELEVNPLKTIQSA